MKVKYIGINNFEKGRYGDDAHKYNIANTSDHIFLIVEDSEDGSSSILRYDSLKELLTEWEEV